jgi:16S rRNA (guanine527-N7)-methyltransferase
VDQQAFTAGCAALGLPLTEEQLFAFTQFEENLYAANAVMNLTRIPQEECWLRHFLDSLLFHDLIPTQNSVLDIGTGPGFPAWPLACARPDLNVTALDSSSKMLGFLARNQLPNLHLENARAEDWGVRLKFQVVTGRALAPLPIQLELSAPAAKVGGLIIAMRSAKEEAEILAFEPQRFGISLEKVEHRTLPGTDIERIFPVYRKDRATPREFPRKWAEIRKNPS